jgi:ATP synthase F1 delta subunit
VAEDGNIADVEVVSATALDERQQQRLAAALRTRLRRDVRLHCAVDPALIGGAVVRSGDMLIDGSFAGKARAARDGFDCLKRFNRPGRHGPGLQRIA